VASAAAALIFAIRLVAVSRGDADTETLLLANTSVGDAVRILLLELLPLLLLLFPSVIAFLAGRREGLEAGGLLGTTILIIILDVYVSGDMDSDWWKDAAKIGALPLLVFYLSRLWAKSQRQGAEDESQGVQVVLINVAVSLFGLLAMLGMSGLFGDHFWLPRESLDFADEGTPLIGYVLKTSGDHFVILKDDPRIVIEKKGPPRNRDFCYPERHKKDLEKAGRVPPMCPPAPSTDPYGPSLPSWLDPIIRALDS
jgi:hypothetical protein